MRSYTLKTEHGGWLGQVVLTDDGMFASVTDYGNFSFAWRTYGDGDFRQFILFLNEDYFASKMYAGISYIVCGKKYEKACSRFANKILPALKLEIQKELDSESRIKKVHFNVETISRDKIQINENHD